MIEQHRSQSAENALQGHNHGSDRGVGILHAPGLQEEAKRRAHEAEVGNLAPGIQGHVHRRRLKQQRPHPADHGRRGKLHGRDGDRVAAVPILLQHDDLERIEDAAKQRQHIADVHPADPLIERHKADAGDTQEGGDHIGQARLPLIDPPGQKGGQHTVGGGEEGVLAGGGKHQAIGLHDVGQGQAKAHQGTALHTALADGFDPLARHRQHHQCRHGEADGQHPHGAHAVQGVLQHHERGAPNHCAKQQGDPAH